MYQVSSRVPLTFKMEVILLSFFVVGRECRGEWVQEEELEGHHRVLKAASPVLRLHMMIKKRANQNYSSVTCFVQAGKITPFTFNPNRSA